MTTWNRAALARSGMTPEQIELMLPLSVEGKPSYIKSVSQDNEQAALSASECRREIDRLTEVARGLGLVR